MQSLPYIRNSSKHPTTSNPVFNPQPAGGFYSDAYAQNGSLNYQPQYYIPPQIDAQQGRLLGDKNGRNAYSFQGGQAYYRNSPYMPMPYMQPKSLSHIEREENNERLLDLIERQTHVIGSLNTKIVYQEQKKIQQEKKELKERLKQLEVANAMQQREIDARLRANFVSLSPKPNKRDFESADKIKGSRMLQMLGKLIIGNENGSQNGDDSVRYANPRQDDDDLYEPSDNKPKSRRKSSKKSKTSNNLDGYRNY